MSVPFGRAILSLDDITKQIRRTFEQFTDPRRGKNTRYTLVDAGLSAFSVFFMQSPSFLEYQRSLDQPAILILTNFHQPVGAVKQELSTGCG